MKSDRLHQRSRTATGLRSSSRPPSVYDACAQSFAAMTDTPAARKTPLPLLAHGERTGGRAGAGDRGPELLGLPSRTGPRTLEARSQRPTIRGQRPLRLRHERSADGGRRRAAEPSSPSTPAQVIQSERYLFPRAVLDHAMEVSAAKPQVDLDWIAGGLRNGGRTGPQGRRWSRRGGRLFRSAFSPPTFRTARCAPTSRSTVSATPGDHACSEARGWRCRAFPSSIAKCEVGSGLRYESDFPPPGGGVEATPAPRARSLGADRRAPLPARKRVTACSRPETKSP